MRSIFAALCGIILQPVHADNTMPGDVYDRPIHYVWFGPSYSMSDGVRLGSVDNAKLYDDDSPWAQARNRVQIFKLPTHAVANMSDADLTRMLIFLKRHHIAFALEYGILPASDECGRGIEGFLPERMPTQVSRRVQHFGGSIALIVMDEPLYYGAEYPGTSACRWPVQKIADNGARGLAQFRAIFPNVRIGDEEPVTLFKSVDWLDEMREWILAFRSATGEKLAFFHDDMIWKDPIAEKTQALIGLLQSEGIRFGVIFNSKGEVASDSEWLKSAQDNIKAYRKTRLPEPDDLIFQSWQRYPSHVLPETSQDTLTYLVNYYFGGSR